MKYNVSIVFKEGCDRRRLRLYQERLLRAGFTIFMIDKYTMDTKSITEKVTPARTMTTTVIKAIYNNDEPLSSRLITSLQKSGLLETYKEVINLQ